MLQKLLRTSSIKTKKLPGNYWFNVVLLRGEIALYKIDKNEEHIKWFKDDANRTWREEKDDKNLLGRKIIKEKA